MTKLLITDAFKKKELQKLKKQYTIDDIKKTAKKVSVSGIELSHLGYKHGHLVKVRVVSKVAGRMIAFLFKSDDIVVPIVIRLKSDKIFGENLSLENKKAKKLILKMLDAVMNDITNDKFEKIIL